MAIPNNATNIPKQWLKYPDGENDRKDDDFKKHGRHDDHDRKDDDFKKHGRHDDHDGKEGKKDDDFKKHGRHDDDCGDSKKDANHDDDCGDSKHAPNGDDCVGNGYASNDAYNADMTDLHGVLASMPAAQAIDFAIDHLGSTDGLFDVASFDVTDTSPSDTLT